jgi:AcrR family transcriptional regulator
MASSLVNRELRGAMTGAEENEELDLAAEKRQLTEKRILRATVAAMAQRGFAVTVEEIAGLAGVSARTVYRYFDTHDQLIAAGIRESLATAGQLIDSLPSVHDDFDGWLERIALEAATRNATIIGAAFWDLVGPNPSASKELQEARALRRSTRMDWMSHLAGVAWTTAGGEGEPPSSVLTTFALALSAFTFHALAADLDYGPKETARFTASMIKERLTAAVDAQRRSSAEPGRMMMTSDAATGE